MDGFGRFLRAWAGYLALVALFTIVSFAFIGLPRLTAPDAWNDSVVVAAFGVQALIGAFTGVAGSTAWLRWVVDPKQSLRLQWKRAEWIFLGRLVQFGIICTVSLLVVSFIVTLIGIFAFGEAVQSPVGERLLSAELLFALIGTAVFVGPVSLCASWYSLSLPAAACGEPSGLLMAQDRAKGHAGGMFWAFAIAIAVPMLAIALTDSLLVSAVPLSVLYTIGWLLQFLAYVIFLTIAGLYFRSLRAAWIEGVPANTGILPGDESE